MTDQNRRGSDKLMAAWRAREVSEAAVQEIAEALDRSPAIVDRASVFGGANPTGVQVSLSYVGDDVSWCGNDIVFWLKWHLKHGGSIRPPKIIINGIPYPDLVRLDLEFGQVGQLVRGSLDLDESLQIEGLGG